MNGWMLEEVLMSREIFDPISGGCSMMVLAAFDNNSLNSNECLSSEYWLKASLRKILV